ncbi:MAG TPA: tetratricopeptide repeat protein, partial [Gemmataceae bacterium]|nr:tetratricopeptide repeat protein [Gemmataceae bacterium]
RRVVDELARHSRLITAIADNSRKFADELGYSVDAEMNLCTRAREILRQFGLDPIDGSADEVARAVATSRIRDVLLGELLEWQLHVKFLGPRIKRNPNASDLPADSPILADRLARVIRSARQRCGGAYARWQDLLDRDDVPGLVAFAASPDGLSFRSLLANAVGWDLDQAQQHAACQSYLRAAIDRYPHDPWLHSGLADACSRLVPADHAEALRHHSAASALQPDSAYFHLMVATEYADLGSYDQAIAVYRKVISRFPVYGGYANLQMGNALSKKEDWSGAIAAFREAIRLLSEQQQSYLTSAYENLCAALIASGRPAEVDDVFREALRLKLMPDEPSGLASLGRALVTAGGPAEALRRSLAALRQNPAWAEDPRNHLRYNAARFAMNCVDGKGKDVPPPSERPAYLRQALDLLTAELVAIRKLAATDAAFVHRTVAYWLVDEDLQPARDPKVVERLPQDERDAWAKLWADVRDLRDRTRPPEVAPAPRAVNR